MIKQWIGVLLAPPPCKSSRPSGGLIHPVLKSATSMPTTSAPSSNFPLPPASRHLNLSAPFQGIWILTPSPKVSYRLVSPPSWSSAPLNPEVSSASALPPWRTSPWTGACHWAPYIWKIKRIFSVASVNIDLQDFMGGFTVLFESCSTMLVIVKLSSPFFLVLNEKNDHQIMVDYPHHKIWCLGTNSYLLTGSLP